MKNPIDDEIGLATAPKDEEIGLTGSHMDDEVGLTSGGGKVGFTPLLRSLEFSLDGNFLAVSDQFGHLTVYGRVQADPPASPPELSGEWLGTAGSLSGEPVSFEWDGKELIGDLGLGGSVFTGSYNSGYFIGTVEGGAVQAMVALDPLSASDLNGTYCAAPYGETSPVYDFMRR